VQCHDLYPVTSQSDGKANEHRCAKLANSAHVSGEYTKTANTIVAVTFIKLTELSPLGKIIGVQVVKKLLVFDRIHRFISVFTRTRVWTLF
jgi:hypothetical protein